MRHKTKIAAIVAEYNPLHAGHIYQIQEVRKRSGADQILILMSGDFVQRGEPAILDKYVRTRMALAAGANLVLELPVAAATGSAGEFAAGAVAVLDALGAVDELWFGSEEGCTEPLLKIASVLAEEPAVFRNVLRDELNRGASFPAAQETALAAFFAEEKGQSSPELLQELHRRMSGPNNTLAISYMKELLRRESRIVPCTIRREGEGYNSLETGRGFSSASAIRHALFAAEGEEGDKKRQQALEGLPAYVVSCLDGSGPLVCADDFSEMLFARLLYEEHPECYASVTEDLANRLRRNVRNCHTFTELADVLKTRNLTRTRVNRALLHILLGIRKGDARKCVRPEIVRLLGMRGAEPSFHTIHAAAGVKLSASVAKMPEEIYGADRRASDLYEWVRSAKAGEPMRPEATRMPVKI